MNRRKFIKLFSLGSLGNLLGAGLWFSRPHDKNLYYSGPVSDHFNGQTFFNPGGLKPRKFSDFLKWKVLEKPHNWPENFISDFHKTIPKQKVAGNQIETTLIGHATFLIQVNGLNLITDPIYSERASPFNFAGPKRVNPPGIEFDNLPSIDVVLLTHNHYDHLDLSTLSKLVTRDNPIIIAPLGNDAIINSGVSGANVHSGDWHDEVSISENVKIHFEPCHHWSARSTRDRRMALWSAFVIESPAGKIYYIGDTGFHSGINYRQAGEKHGDFELAIIPIGAYEPRWFMKGQHQNPFEAVEGFKLCNTRFAVGHHWGTFQLTNEPIEQPKELLAKALEESGLAKERFIAMVPGQVWKNELN